MTQTIDDDTDVAEDATDPADAAEPESPTERPPRSWWAHAAAPTIVVALLALGGWLGFGVYQTHRDAQQREAFLQVGRQGAINVTTIDFAEADADVQRIVDSSTGTFHDDFVNRSGPFIEVVKQARSKSVGTVTTAGLESSTADGAQVLVAVSVHTSNAGAAEQQPRDWRMRITVQKVGDDAKVSKVEFVP